MGQSGVFFPYVQWGEEAGLVPSERLDIQLDHLVPKIDTDWFSWLLSPAMGLGHCAGRQGMSVQACFVLQPTLGGSSSPFCCQVPGLVSEAQAGI